MSNWSKKYTEHIRSLFREYAGFEGDSEKIEKIINNYTDGASMELFIEAVTHSSYDPEYNYDLLEFYGDTKLNEFASEYIAFIHPNVVNIQWLDKIRHHLQSRDIFMKFTFELGLDRFLRVGNDENVQNILNDSTGREQKKYEKLMGDLSESFFQALYLTMRMKLSPGSAYQTCYNFAMKLFRKVVGDIPLKYELYFDAKTLLKETVEKYPFGWIEKGNIASLKKVRRNEDGSFTVSFIGYPHGKDEKSKIIGTATEMNENVAERKAAQNALDYLERINMRTKIPDPFSRFAKKIKKFDV